MLDTEERVDLGEHGQEEPTHVSTTFFVRTGDSPKLVVPCFTRFIATLELFFGKRVYKSGCRFSFRAIDQFASPVAQELVTRYMHDIASLCIVGKESGLFFSGEFDRIKVDSSH